MNKFLYTISNARFGIRIALITANRTAFENLNHQVIEALNRENPGIQGVCWGGGDAVIVQRSWNRDRR